MTNRPALQVQQLSADIQSKPILSQIDFELGHGRVLGVLGPNGAGKTTLLKAITSGCQASSSSRHQVQFSGRVIWQNQDIGSLSPNRRARQIALVRQLNDPVFELTLRQVVRMGLLPHQSWLALPNNNEEQQITAALAQVGLADKSGQTFSTLSGGEQQRGLIARALVQQSQLLVLDEPVNHLDVYYQFQILGLLKQLTEQGITVLMSLHDINLAALYCDDLLILKQGKQMAFGPVHQVLEQALIEQVFEVPCAVRKSEQGVRVDFCPEPYQEQNKVQSPVGGATS
ncbi:MAG: ABC transporter ATP-binding protein [Oceanobacter sp.]